MPGLVLVWNWRARPGQSAWVPLAAACSFVLWTNGDRLVAPLGLSNFFFDHLRVVSLEGFDAYQAAGVIARGALALLFPFLVVLQAERAPLRDSTLRSIRGSVIHLGLLVLVAFGLWYGAPGLAALFGGAKANEIALDLQHFMLPTVLLGILQNFTVFCLASRRLPELLALAGFALFYVFVLGYFVRGAENYPPAVFAVFLCSLSVVTVIGLVRWGRRQP